MTAWVDEVTAAAGENRIWEPGSSSATGSTPPLPPAGPRPRRPIPRSSRRPTSPDPRGSSPMPPRCWAATTTPRGTARWPTRCAPRSTASTSPARVGCSPTPRPPTPSRSSSTSFRTTSERRRAADRLAQIVKENGYRISTGFIGTPLICDALSANGHADTAYRLLFQTENPSWLYAVKMGATTIWERWDSLLPDGTVNPSGMTSFNHYAFGAVADWMHRVVAGLAPAAPGYRRLRIAPQPPRRGLTEASARLRTPYGDASSAWTLDDGMLRLTVVVPVGATAEVDPSLGLRARARARHPLVRGAVRGRDRSPAGPSPSTLRSANSSTTQRPWPC